VTGFGVVTPIGDTPERFWNALLEGRSGARPVRSFDTSALPNHVGCEVEDVPPPPGLAGGAGRCTRLAAAAAEQALRRAGFDLPLAPGDDSALIVGTTMGEVTRFEQDRVTRAEQEPGPEDVRSLVDRPLDGIGRDLAAAIGLSGAVVTVPAACAAGAYAVGLAAQMVRRGDVSCAVAVGCEAFSRLAFLGFTRMRAMSPDVCRPFSRGRPGLLLGEGAGAVVIEAERSARARGAEPLGFVDGFGLSCDAYHVTGPHPQGEGAARAVRDALERAAIAPGEIDYVNAHGTGTLHNDRSESHALHAALGERARRVPVSSIKALTGHMLGAAGAVEVVATLLALRHGVIPPTWNWLETDPDCDVDCVPNEPRPARLRLALCNSYAFGGNNASLVLAAAGH
jgi:3-oxoacyl-[acyl-carrier-protein] synthase II